MKLCESCGTENESTNNYCGGCGVKFPPIPEKITTKVYLHSSKEDMYYKGEELGLSGEALENFKYCCYEVCLDIEIDTKTGEYKILGVSEK